MIKKPAMVLFIVFTALSIRCFSVRLSIESPAFATNTLMPVNYTCNGENHSPPLNWKNAPTGTKSYVLMVEDPDAPNGTWVHWLLFNIPATQSLLTDATELPKGAISGKNSWGTPGYGGPCPPSGTHRYYFKLYALDSRLTVNSSVSKDDILNAMEGHILETSELIGLYTRVRSF